MSSCVNKFPPYVLLTTRDGGVGERALGLRRLTSAEAGGAGVGYSTVSGNKYNKGL